MQRIIATVRIIVQCSGVQGFEVVKAYSTQGPNSKMDVVRLEDTFPRTHISSDMPTLLNSGVKLGPTE